jgi:type II secretory pathway predicted ATPase ExeA
MGRKSKLTEAQWEQVGKRLLAGEKPRALARELGLAESTIRERFSDINGKIKTVANQIVATDGALRALPISAQIAAISLADDLKAISHHLAGAAKYGSATAHRLSALAHGQVQKIDDANPLNPESVEAMKGVALMTKLANDSSQIGVNLLAANKEIAQRLNAPEEPENQPKGVLVVPGIMADPGAWAAAVEKSKPKA